MLERDVEHYLVWIVARMGGKAKKIRFIGESGCPDRLVLLPGETWLIELKRPKGGKLSALQKLFAEDMKQLRQRYACLWSIEQINQWADERLSSNPTLTHY